jgi:prepilin signal peptidase PulO-like enzyme (type II secretory pathway)
MEIDNAEMLVFAMALLLTTINVFVYGWIIERGRHLQIGAWIIRFLAAVPAFFAVSWGLYLQAHDPESTLAKALTAAGLLLIAGGLQLIVLISRHRTRSTAETGH